MDTCFAIAAFGSRATNHSVLNMSPRAFVFQKDMVFNMPCIVDYLYHHRRQQINIDDHS